MKSVLLVLLLCGSASGEVIRMAEYSRSLIRSDGFTFGRGRWERTWTGIRDGMEHRSFFAFDLSGVSYRIVSATFDIETTFFESPDASETLQLRHMHSAPGPRATHEGIGYFADAGDGAIYGSRDFSPADDFMTRNITLNAEAIAALNAARGGFFQLGAQLTSLSGQTAVREMLFSRFEREPWSGLTLVTGPVPEPSSLVLMLGVVVGLAFLRRR